VQGDTDYAVIVVSHDHAEVLSACLGAVAALEPAPVETVVIDNASSDGSAELAEGRDRICLIHEPANTGFAAAVNHGLRETSAPWVLLLKPDCAPRPDFVGRLLGAALGRLERDEIGAVTGRLIRAADTALSPSGTLDAAGMVVTASGRHLDRGAGEPDDGRYGTPAWVFGGTGAATLYRRSALDDVANPDGQVLAESFFAYREDAELAWRLQWRGWRCLYVPDAVAVHGRGFRPEQGRRGHELVNRLSVRNRLLLRIHCADLGWQQRTGPAPRRQHDARRDGLADHHRGAAPRRRQRLRRRPDPRRVPPDAPVPD